MSTVKLTKWGNSIGIRIPSSVIKEAHFYPGAELEIKVDKKGLVTLIPVSDQQKGWLEQFNAVADATSEEMYSDVANEFDRDEWTW